jgi:hypothetical protein
MNRHETPIPRIAFGIAAVAMTALTIGVAVVMPAKMDFDSREPRTLATLKVTAPASTGVVAGSNNIDVVAVHETRFSAVPRTSSNPNREPES